MPETLHTLILAAAPPFETERRKQDPACLWLRVLPFATPWTAAPQAPVSVGFSSQEGYSGLPRPPLGDLPDPGIEPRLSRLHLQTGSLPLAPPGEPCLPVQPL